MPTYEYACRACAHRFDIVQKMSDDPLVICPECGGELRKVFAPPAISFKGSGFYTTDHGKKTKAPPSSEKGDESKSSESESKSSESESKSEPKSSTSESTSESKPEKKAEKKAESPTKEGTSS